MYQTPSVLSRPRNSLQPLWRYLRYERLMDLLDSEELFFAHLRGLSDGLEGSLTERTRSKLFQWFYGQYNDATLARQALETYENHRDAFFVNCWHMNDAESYLMWKVYGDRGFAIRTTFERVQISFDRFAGEVNGGVVEYIDFAREATQIGNVFTPVVKKDMPYRDEREFRLLLWQPNQANQWIDVNVPGVRVQVDLAKLIEKIYISPRVKEVPPALRQLLDRKSLTCPVISSAINERVTS
jgi:hypothetical protein